MDEETVQDYKYLGVYPDNKLDFAKNNEAVDKRCQSRLYFLLIRCLHAKDVLPVCGSQCYFLCYRVLGQQGQGC